MSQVFEDVELAFVVQTTRYTFELAVTASLRVTEVLVIVTLLWVNRYIAQMVEMFVRKKGGVVVSND